MLPTSTTPSVVQVGTSAVGDPSPGKHAAILTNRPGCPDLHIHEASCMLACPIFIQDTKLGLQSVSKTYRTWVYFCQYRDATDEGTA